MIDTTETTTQRRLATVDKIAADPRYPFTKSSMRHLIFGATDRFNSAGEKVPGNGLAVAIRRIGRRVLIDLDDFEDWLDQHRCSEKEG